MMSDDDDDDDYPMMARWTIWKHTVGSQTYQPDAGPYDMNRGAQQGDIEGGPEASAAITVQSRQIKV